MRDADVRLLSAQGGVFAAGLVPVVTVKKMTRSRQLAANIRHNRARGLHGILKMADIVRELKAAGNSAKQIQSMIGMDKEEYERLVDASPQTSKMGGDTPDSFGRGWVPARQSDILNETADDETTADDEN